jgi:hypothetical protein
LEPDLIYMGKGGGLLPSSGFEPCKRLVELMGADLLLTLLVLKDGGDWMEPAVARLNKPVDAQERSHPRFQVSPVRMTS